MRRTFLFSVILLNVIISIAQPCPKWGDATSTAKKNLNIAKNRGVTINSSKAAALLPLGNLITSRKKSDKNNFLNGAYVFTEGYLISFEEEGPESCNCGHADKRLKDGDVHIYIGLVKDAPKKNCIVVEITPAFKKKFPNYESLLSNNARVRITGFLLYDYLHENAAFTTCTSCKHLWRKTCWEIHPITKIELL